MGDRPSTPDREQHEAAERICDMLGRLPEEGRTYLVALMTHGYEALSRLGPQRLATVAASRPPRPGETSLERLLDELCELTLISPFATQSECALATRTRSHQRLEQLLRDDGGGAPLTSAEAARRLGKTPQVLNRQAKRGQYVCVSQQGRHLYPRWQFGPDDYVPSRALASLFELYGSARRWQWIAFLRTPQGDLENQTPMQWLLLGQDDAPVRRLARKGLGQIEAL